MNRFESILQSIFYPVLKLKIEKEDTPEQAVKKVRRHSTKKAWTGTILDWIIGGVVSLLLVIIYQSFGAEGEFLQMWADVTILGMAIYYTAATVEHNTQIIYKETVNYIAEQGRKK